jgi:hypothetical protein
MSTNRIRVLLVSLLAVFAISAVAASAASAANEGPKWKGHFCVKAKPAGTGEWKKKGATGKCEEIDATKKSEWEKIIGELPAGETEPITFKSTVTKLEVPKTGTIITCQKDTGTGNIKGNGANPGTDEATILFEECSTSETCKAHNVGTEDIEVPVNSELAYETKSAAEKHEEPVGIIFRTKGNTTAKFVTIKFTGTGCTVAETTVNATGNAVGTAPGKAGVFCKIKPVATTEAVVHEISCPATAVKAAWNWIGGVLTEHKIGLEAFGFEAKQVGEAKISLTSGEMFSVIL